jgi:hypothetical protein
MLMGLFNASTGPYHQVNVTKTGFHLPFAILVVLFRNYEIYRLLKLNLNHAKSHYNYPGSRYTFKFSILLKEQMRESFA